MLTHSDVPWVSSMCHTAIRYADGGMPSCLVRRVLARCGSWPDSVDLLWRHLPQIIDELFDPGDFPLAGYFGGPFERGGIPTCIHAIIDEDDRHLFKVEPACKLDNPGYIYSQFAVSISRDEVIRVLGNQSINFCANVGFALVSTPALAELIGRYSAFAAPEDRIPLNLVRKILVLQRDADGVDYADLSSLGSPANG